MKMLSFHFILSIVVCLIYTTFNLAGAAPLSPTECMTVGYKTDNQYNARVFATNLNVGEPRTVRMIYFLPNDQSYRANVVQRMKDEIRNVQALYARGMQWQGYPNTTFHIETDAKEEPVVHRVDGQYPNSYYIDKPSHKVFSTIFSEIQRRFDLHANVYFVVLDNNSNLIGNSAGSGNPSGKVGGMALVPGDFEFKLVAHELGHAFGLQHDLRNSAHIMSYGPEEDRLSACNANFLAMHPHFNTNNPIESGQPPKIQLISSPKYFAGPKSIKIQLKVSDSEGLHQVILFIEHPVDGFLNVKACRRLANERETVVEFEYDGNIYPPDHFAATNLSNLDKHSFRVAAIDINGDVGYESFILSETSYHHIAAEHVHPIDFIAFSPDGTMLASGSSGKDRVENGVRKTDHGIVKLWDVVTKANIATFEVPTTNNLGPILFSPDETTFAYSFPDTVQLWDVTTKTNIITLTHSWVNSISFSPNGKMLASSNSQTVKLWEVITGKNITTIKEGTNNNCLSFSPDGETLAFGEFGTISLYNAATGKLIATIDGQYPNRVKAVMFTPNGKMLVAGFSGSYNDTIKLWDIATMENVVTFKLPSRYVENLSCSPDGTTIASSGWGDVYLWDIATGHHLNTIKASTELAGISSIAFSPDGVMLACGTSKGWIELWNTFEWTRPRPYALTKISGDNQHGTSNMALANPLVVEVIDQNGNPFPDATITFTVAQGMGRLGDKFTVKNIMTDANGQAECIFTLGPYSGPNTVEVSMGERKFVTFYAMGEETPNGVNNMEGDYQMWGLPNGAMIRLGKGRISQSNKACAFSQDSQHLAVASSIGIWVYDVVTASELMFLPTESPANSVWFLPDGNTLISGSSEGVKLWNVITGKNTTTWESERVNSVAFLPDGKITGASFDNKTIRLWDVVTGKGITALEGHTSKVNSVVFSPDGKTLASSSDDRTVKLWDIATAENTATLEGRKSINLLVFSPDGKTLAYGAGSRVWLWDVTTGHNLNVFEQTNIFEQINDVVSLSFSPDGKTLVSGTRRGMMLLWDIATGENITTLKGHTAYTPSLASLTFSSNGKFLASASSEDGVKLWDIETQNVVDLGHIPIHSASFSPDGRMLGTVSNQKVQLWDVITGQIITTIEHVDTYPIAFSPDGTILALGSNNSIKLWDTMANENITTLWTISGASIIQFSPDGTILASAGSSEQVQLWNVITRTRITSLKGGGRYMLFSPDGTILALGSELWDTTTWENITTIEGPVTSLSFSPDGSILVIGAYNECKLWNVTTGEITTFSHAGGSTPAVLSPDKEILATVSSAGVELWDITTGQSIKTFGYIHWIYSLSFLPDGEILAIISPEKEVKLWNITTDQSLTIFEGRWNQSAFFASDGTIFALNSADVVLLWDTETLKSQFSPSAPANIRLTHIPQTELLPNYPNPFNPETWIPYQLAEDANVKLNIYDASGHLVRSLDVGYNKAGIYESRDKAIYWDGRNDLGEQVASGVYFFHLSAGKYSATRQMIILK